jgi:membrane-associated phospholipid phosphatase
VVSYTPGTNPGDWQPTPPAFLPALAPQWPYVTPFAMTSGSKLRPAPPPALDTTAYAAAFNEVKSLGRADSTTRTDEQTQIARFWNDGLGTAFAMGYWNRIAAQVATDRGLSLVQDARLFALLNIAEADAHIACWDAKYAYNLWRPVTAIRAADTDNNPATDPDATWTPLLVTPNFPSYTSAHSTLSGAAAEVLTALFGDSYHFTVGSEGVPGVTRSFSSFEGAAAEAGQSRIYGGIHFQFDNQGGLASGHALGQFVVGNFLLPAAGEDGGDGLPDGRPAGPAAGRADGPVVSAGPGNTSPDGWDLFGRQQGGAPAAGQPRPQPPQPISVLAATSFDVGQPGQPAGAGDWLAARASGRRALDPALADLNGSLFAGPLPGDEVFAWAG